MLKRVGYVSKDIIGAIISLYTSDKSNFEYIKERAIERRIIDSWKKDKNGFINVKSRLCNDIKFKKISDATSSKGLQDFVKRNNIHSLCHENTEILLNKIKDSKAVTSYCKPTFRGNKMFHSFIITDDNMVVDANTNLYMPKGMYYNFYDVDEISVVNRDEFKSLDAKAKKYDVKHSTLYPLIRIAMYKKYFEQEQNSNPAFNGDIDL